MNTRVWQLVCSGWAIAALLLIGCAETPKAPQPASSQVKSDSDRFFDKMKQDEREQGKGMTPVH